MIGATMFWPVVAAVMGLVVGSFLNVVINRIKLRKSINGRSECPNCKHVLAPKDLVPLFSYAWLRGHCRYCDAKISWQYPVVEFVTALSFLIFMGKFGGPGLDLFFSLVLASYYIVIGVYDVKHFLILDKFVYPATAIAATYALINGTFLSGIYGALAISGFFYVQYLISQGKWIGFGDVKFGLLLGMTAGFPLAVMLLFMAYMLGAVVGVGMIAFGGKQMTSKIPFGVFLSLAAIITMYKGQEILDWYLTLVGFN